MGSDESIWSYVIRACEACGHPVLEEDAEGGTIAEIYYSVLCSRCQMKVDRVDSEREEKQGEG